MYRRNRGFTIVELAVVLVVISILMTIVFVGYGRVQMQARDTKRQADAASFGESLNRYYDKRGEYPSSCADGQYNPSTRVCSQAILSMTQPSVGPPINGNTDDAKLQTIGILHPEKIRDPRGTTPNVFGFIGNPSSNGQYFYVYAGPIHNLRSSDLTAVSPYSIRINGKQCEYSITIPSRGFSSYIFAYFGESDQKIHLVNGKEGGQAVVQPANSANCTVDTA